MEEGEVFLTFSRETGKKIVVEAERAIVSRNPCLHPGDIQIVKIVKSPELEKRLGHFVNCLVFPRKGRRPLTNMVSGGDLDGDIYFICWEERLIPSYCPTPMDFKPKRKKHSNLKFFNVNEIKKIINFFFINPFF